MKQLLVICRVGGRTAVGGSVWRVVAGSERWWWVVVGRNAASRWPVNDGAPQAPLRLPPQELPEGPARLPLQQRRRHSARRRLHRCW